MSNLQHSADPTHKPCAHVRAISTNPHKMRLLTDNPKARLVAHIAFTQPLYPQTPHKWFHTAAVSFQKWIGGVPIPQCLWLVCPLLPISCRQTLCTVDCIPALLSSAAPQQHQGAAVLHCRCNMHPNPHPTSNTGAMCYSCAP